MAEINILSDLVINKISAGEVVERPASVVKELIENSLDADADSILMEILDSGRKLILVEDNGKGMTEKDIPLSIMRYATSKIKDERDLEAISTLGFRGEALAAICAVSRLRIESRQRGSNSGFAMETEGGKAGEVFPVGIKEGTRIIVKDLFYNTPARSKFLKSDPVELSHIISVVETYSLSKHSTSFVLKSNNSSVIEVFPAKSEKERFFDLFPEFNSSDFREISAKKGTVEITGLIGDPSKNFSSMRYIFTSVNGRFVKDKLLSSAILKAYEETFPKGRYPIVYLSLKLPFEEVDVNVHPTKREIKFKTPYVVYDFICKTIFNVLHPSNRGSLSFEEAKKNLIKSESTNLSGQNYEVKEPFSLFDGVLNTLSEKEKSIAPPPSQYKVLAIWRKGFIIADSPKGLSIVDQHTLHERIRFEQLRNFIEKRGEKKQFLEVRCYSVPRNLKSRIDELCLILNEQGFQAESVGENAIGIRSYPAFFEEKEIDPLIEEFISEGGEVLKTPREHYKSVLVMRSCRGAIMLGDEISIEKAQYLLDKLFSLNAPLTCPHGRPIFYTLSENEILAKFHRR